MQSREQLEDLARELQLLILARRAYRMRGDEEGLELANLACDAVEEMCPGIIDRCNKTVAGCGVSLSKHDLERVKDGLRDDLVARGVQVELALLKPRCLHCSKPVGDTDTFCSEVCRLDSAAAERRNYD